MSYNQTTKASKQTSKQTSNNCSAFAAILMAFLLSLAGCSETAEDAPAYYQKAVAFVAEDQLDLALVQLKSALRLDPKMQPALELRLQLHEQQKDYAAVIETIDRLLALDPKHLKALLRKGELLLLAGEAEASKEPIEQALSLAPENVEAQNLWAAWLMRDKQFQPALEASNRARETTPIDSETYALAIMIRLRMQRLTEAETLVTKALVEHPKAQALHLLRISIAHSQGQFSSIPGYYDTLIELFPKDINYPRELALFYLRDDREVQATKTMQEMVARNPTDVDAKFLLGQLLARENSTEAFGKMEGLLSDQPQATQLRFLLARLYEDSERYSQAISHYQTLAKQDATSSEVLTAKSELARIALNQGRSDEANTMVDAILAEEATHAAALLLKAHILLLKQQVGGAVILLRTVLRDEPENDRALEALGRSYLLTDSRSLAIDSFSSALSANPLNKQAAKQLATLHMQDRDLESAENVLAPFEAAQVVDTDIERALLQIRLMRQDWKGAQRLASNGQLGQNNPLFKELVSALVQQGNNQFEESIQRLKKILASDGGNVRTVLMALATGYQGANQLDEGVTFFKQYRSANPEKPWSDDLLFDMFIRADQKTSAIEHLNQRIATNRSTPKDFGLLARLHNDAGDTEIAISRLEAGIKDFPASLPLQLNKATLLESIGKHSLAITAYEEILATNPESDLAANNLAVLYSSSPETLGKALELASRFRSTRQPYYADTLGWICTLANDSTCGLPLLELAVRRLPEQAEFQYHLGAALVRADQKNRGIQHLEKAAKLLSAGATFAGSEAVVVLLDKVADELSAQPGT